MTFYLKQHDTLPALEASLINPDGTAVDLTGAAVKFVMTAADGTPVVDAAGAIVAPATDGKVRYDWLAEDTAVPGAYRAEFEVTFVGSRYTFPNNDYLAVQITKSLGQ